MTLDLDALEAIARAVDTRGPWETRCEGPGEPTWVCHDSEAVLFLGFDTIAEFDANDAEHIATFDPPTVLALITRVREAEREMHARELHHFEEEQKLAQAEAVIEKVLSMLPGPRTFVESLSRDFEGNLWPRTVDADEISAALATYKPTNQEKSE